MFATKSSAKPSKLGSLDKFTISFQLGSVSHSGAGFGLDLSSLVAPESRNLQSWSSMSPLCFNILIERVKEKRSLCASKRDLQILLYRDNVK